MTDVKESKDVGVEKGELNEQKDVELLAYAYDPTKFYIHLDGERVHGSPYGRIAHLETTSEGQVLKLYLQATSSWVPKLKDKIGENFDVETGYTPSRGSISYEQALKNSFKAQLISSFLEVGGEFPNVVFILSGVKYNQDQWKKEVTHKMRASRG